MRIRIRQKRRGEIDGVSLDKFQVGLTYEVQPSLATYLITTGCAEFDVKDDQRGVVPLGPLAAWPKQD